MEKRDSAYWPDKNDPLGRVHGKVKLDKVTSELTAKHFLEWSKTAKSATEINCVKSRLDPDDKWLDEACMTVSLSYSSFCQSAKMCIEDEVLEKAQEALNRVQKENEAVMSKMRNAVFVSADPMRAVRDLCK